VEAPELVLGSQSANNLDQNKAHTYVIKTTLSGPAPVPPPAVSPVAATSVMYDSDNQRLVLTYADNSTANAIRQIDCDFNYNDLDFSWTGIEDRKPYSVSGNVIYIDEIPNKPTHVRIIVLFNGSEEPNDTTYTIDSALPPSVGYNFVILGSNNGVITYNGSYTAPYSVGIWGTNDANLTVGTGGYNGWDFIGEASGLAKSGTNLTFDMSGVQSRAYYRFFEMNQGEIPLSDKFPVAAPQSAPPVGYNFVILGSNNGVITYNGSYTAPYSVGIWGTDNPNLTVGTGGYNGWDFIGEASGLAKSGTNLTFDMSGVQSKTYYRFFEMNQGEIPLSDKFTVSFPVAPPPTSSSLTITSFNPSTNKLSFTKIGNANFAIRIDATPIELGTMLYLSNNTETDGTYNDVNGYNSGQFPSSGTLNVINGADVVSTFTYSSAPNPGFTPENPTNVSYSGNTFTFNLPNTIAQLDFVTIYSFINDTTYKGVKNPLSAGEGDYVLNITGVTVSFTLSVALSGPISIETYYDSYTGNHYGGYYSLEL
jgi:hypothetical protein